MAAVRIVEVGPRDGLQNITQLVPTKTKIELINRLADTGLPNIEATSFVSPKWIPQLADAKQVLSGIQTLLEANSISFPVLVPNLKGLESAKASGVKEVAVFVSATEGFSRKNINCGVDESLERVRAVTEKAKELDIKVRGYVSCIFADPYDGPTHPRQVLKVTQSLLDYGCYEVSLGDTIGVGTPSDVKNLFEELLKTISASKLAGHFHDTYGQAIANVVQSYAMGIRIFDSSVAGLGGCPFAKGAKGNLSTEDLIYTLNGMGIPTGVDLGKLVSIGTWISQSLGIPNGSRAGAALAAKALLSTISAASSSASKINRTWTPYSSTEQYFIQRSGPNIKITLNRPKNGNALTSSMLTSLTSLFRTLSSNKSVSRIILTSTGKYFCTGMDLRNDTSTPSQRYENLKALFESIDSCPQTTIAAVNGPAYGGGVGLAFVCDIRIFGKGAHVKLSEVRLGLCPATISKYVIREWGGAFSRAAMLTGREITPKELMGLGIIQHVVDEGEGQLQRRVDEVLDELRFCAPGAAGLCKELVRGAEMGGDEQERVIKKAFEEMMQSSESKFAMGEFGMAKKGIDWDEVGKKGRESKL